jgi:glycosyltransferase involved in cell wall biosynthesis
MKQNAVTVCIPVFNESKVITQVITDWLFVVRELPKGSGILVEDGGSTDGTKQILKKLESKNNLLKVIYRDKPDGFGNATIRLLKIPRTEWIFFTDGDGQYVPNDFWKLWSRRKGHDLVKGIKLGRKDSMFRRGISYIWSSIIQVMFGLFISDINAAFLLMRRSELSKIIDEVRFLRVLVITEVVIRMLMNNSIKSDDIHILHRKRIGGKSRALPNYKIWIVIFSHLNGLRLIKKDYRVNF